MLNFKKVSQFGVGRVPERKFGCLKERYVGVISVLLYRYCNILCNQSVVELDEKAGKVFWKYRFKNRTRFQETNVVQNSQTWDQSQPSFPCPSCIDKRFIDSQPGGELGIVADSEAIQQNVKQRDFIRNFCGKAIFAGVR